MFKDAILRRSAMYTISMAYAGTGNNKAIRKLLHVAVSLFIYFCVALFTCFSLLFWICRRGRGQSVINIGMHMV